MSYPPERLASREQLLACIRDTDAFLLATHENPDGDAVGSLVGMHRVLCGLGKDSVMYLAPDELPVPYEYRFIALDGLVTEAPADLARRTLVFLDCGNLDRNPAEVLRGVGSPILNVDHHHDNTRFGTIDHVVPEASCTAEIVWDLMRALDLSPSLELAEALYVGLVTDTGKFMYDSTGATAHRMAAELIEVGIDVHAIYRQLFENLPQAKLDLLSRGIDHLARFEDGRLTMSRLTVEDYAATGAESSHSEGLVDYLRAMEGTVVAALARDLLTPDRLGWRKVSLRAADHRVDVSVIARRQGGGGHRRAAGFSTRMDWDELVAFLRQEVVDALLLVHG